MARQHKAFLYRRVTSFRHERCIFEFYKERLKPESIIFDIGANIGLHTVSLGLKASNGTVIAFEPDPDNVALLRENLERNGLSNRVSIVEAAVSDKKEKTVFWRDLISTATGTIAPSRENAWYPEVMGQPPVMMEVDTITIDDYCAAHPDIVPDLIKMDVEGVETQVVTGMHDTLSHHHPTIVMDGAVIDAIRPLMSEDYQIFDLVSKLPFGGNPDEVVPYTILAEWRGSTRV